MINQLLKSRITHVKNEIVQLNVSFVIYLIIHGCTVSNNRELYCGDDS